MRGRRGRRGDRRNIERSRTSRRAGSTAMPTPPPRRRKSCATCFAKAIPGFAPAICCAATPQAIIISSIASATLFAGRARTSRQPRSPRRSRLFPAFGKPMSMACPCRAYEGRAGMAALVVDDPDRFRSRRPARPYRRASAPLCAAGFPAIQTRSRNDRHVQTEEDASSSPKDSIPSAPTIRIYFDDRSLSAYARVTADFAPALRAGSVKL